MVDYRNILRLQSQGHSQREIERELYCSRHTISEVLIRAKAAGIAWPLEDDVTNEDIQAILFPGKLPRTPCRTMRICTESWRKTE